MSTLQLENVPPEVMHRLERLAELSRRTPAEEAVALLARTVTNVPPATDVRATLAWIRSHQVTPAAGTPDSVELLREDRER